MFVRYYYDVILLQGRQRNFVIVNVAENSQPIFLQS